MLNKKNSFFKKKNKSKKQTNSKKKRYDLQKGKLWHFGDPNVRSAGKCAGGHVWMQASLQKGVQEGVGRHVYPGVCPGMGAWLCECGVRVQRSVQQSVQ